MTHAVNNDKDFVVLGKVTSVYGIKGWVKVYSYTDPMDQILDYDSWHLKLNGKWTPIEVDKGRSHGKGMVVHFKGCDDRDLAQKYCQTEIGIPGSLLPELEEGDFYWHQLQGLRVVTKDNQDLGKVNYMMSAGSANDVLVVKGDREAIDGEERLIPYLPDQVVLEVNLEEGKIRVDWDPEF